MLIAILKFEFYRRMKRLDTYLYFALVTLCSMGAVNFIFEGTLGPVKENAPYVIGMAMTISSAFVMMMISMVMGVAVLRDYQYRVESLLFVNPIRKADYLFGRFLGSFFTVILIASGIIWGIILGEYMPWRDPNDLLPFNFWLYFQPFVSIVLPTLFFSSAIFFVSGSLSRKLIVVYTQGILFFMAYLVAMVLAEGPATHHLAALLDPFAFMTIKDIIHFWTPEESNTRMLPMTGILAYNRIIWMAAGVIALGIGYDRFNFHVINAPVFNHRRVMPANKKGDITSYLQHLTWPASTLYFGPRSSIQKLMHLSVFHFRSILKEPSFWAIVICAMAIIFVNSINLGTTFGVNSYPLTYLIVEELQEMSIYFFLIILVFFSGELIWKERELGVAQLVDSTPSSDVIHLGGKLVGLILIYIVLLGAIIISGVLFQTLNGFESYEVDVYLTGIFGGILPSLILYTIVSMWLQVIINHKYLAHLALVVFFIGFGLLEPFGLDHGLYTFDVGHFPRYSAMNGYGHFLAPFVWFKVYWFALAAGLFMLAVIFSVRGLETHLKTRWRTATERLTRPLIVSGFCALLIFVSTGSYIYYNTNVLNPYTFPSTEQSYRANYEKTLKKFEYIAQPKIVDVQLTVDLYPHEQNYTVEGTYMLKNRDSSVITELHIQEQPNHHIEVVDIDLEGGSIIHDTYADFRYVIHTLNHPLNPGDSIKLSFKQTFTSTGFVQNGQTSIVTNGTFFRNDHFLTFGYNRQIEIKDDRTRLEYGLRDRMTRAKRTDQRELANAMSGDDGYEINFEMIVSTDSSQIALVPGNLQRTWIDGDRSYFHYKMAQPMIHFYSIVSGRFKVERDQWGLSSDSTTQNINLEIYYHHAHDYNIDRMMKAMKASLHYYSEHFSPYPYDHARIMEFPRYESFAQSFPGTIPFSESMGFILDIDDTRDVDMAFFITAHEMAHQWWGLHVIPANVEGRHMISESLAQYSAMMVMKNNFPAESIQAILDREMTRYLEGRSSESTYEQPLSTVQNHKYVHYGKGLVNLYALQDYISEDSVNLALSRFIKDWNFIDGMLKQNSYPTTTHLIEYLREVTPDTLQYVITDLLESITLYENQATAARYQALSPGRYKVDLAIKATKLRVDSVGVSSSIAINDWIDIGIYGSGIHQQDSLIYLKKHRISDEMTKLEIIVNNQPTSAGIDPLHKLIDRNLDDNVIAVKQED